MVYKIIEKILNRSNEKEVKTMTKKESKKAPAKKTTKAKALQAEAIKELTAHAMNLGVDFDQDGKAWTAQNDKEQKAGKLTMTKAQIIKAIEAVSNA